MIKREIYLRKIRDSYDYVILIIQDMITIGDFQHYMRKCLQRSEKWKR